EVTKFQSPDGYSIREWKLTIYAINDVGAKFQANFIEKVEYNLHPTFKNPTRIMKKAPFTIIEKGWGEFDMNIRLFFPDKSIDPWNIDFDLNFQKPHYEIDYTRLANNLSSLEGNDILEVIDLITRNRTNDI
ncbi:8906_t:CDS:2, partial [Entrophospora sp. SA101]